ncbi:MAG: BatD family protein [Myxococcota bacterium]
MLSLLATIAFVALSPEAAQPLSVQRRVTPEQVKLGEPFVYELVLTHPKGLRYELRAPPPLEAFEVLEQTRQRVDGADSATTTFRVRLSQFELGKVRLPELTFDVFGDEGSATWVASGVEVEAVPTLPPDAEEKGAGLHDIRPNEEVPVRTFRLLYALAGLLVAAALTYLLLRHLRRPRAAQRPAVPPQPLDVRTVAALDALRAENLPAQGRVREFHFRLSEIVRGYLGERYAFEALECTSGELLDALARLHTPGLSMDELAAFAHGSDLVKFAKASATVEECKVALEFGYRLVQATMAPTQLSGR